MGPPCTSTNCRKIKARDCSRIDESLRKELFQYFWENMNWDQRKIYIASLVKANNVKRRRTDSSKSVPRRSSTLTYTINGKGGTKFNVCKKLFLSTYGLGEWTVSNWVARGIDNAGMTFSTETRNRHRKQPKIPDSIQSSKAFMNEFLDRLPKLPSHYCRASSSKLYLEPVFGNSMSLLYAEYCKKCKEFNGENPIKPLSKATFDNVVAEKSLAFQPPKKDMCDICLSYQAGNTDEDIYTDHILNKDKARAEKQKDKDDGEQGKCIVLTQDLQAVKVCPMLNASALYYKTKLCVHNFTLFNINTKHCKCYWFTETEADLTANTFASCLLDYLTSMNLRGPSQPIIIYSDGCGYQNKNAILSNALLCYSVENNVTIYQKYLQKGHTQMEVDSVHALIERKLKNASIYLPSDYVRITESARRPPYEVKEVTFDLIKDFSKPIVYKSIRPGRTSSDPQVNEIKILKYTPDGKIQAKTSFDGPFLDIPTTRNSAKNAQSVKDFPNLHNQKLKIPEQKYKHLQELKAVIPKDCHPYYDNLPYEQNPSLKKSIKAKNK